MRILLVEDEAPLRETLAARLKREGYAVDAAQDGEEGLYMGREVPFDVGIIDLGLPKMSGMELIKALRDEGKKFPVLIPVSYTHLDVYKRQNLSCRVISRESGVQETGGM